MPTLNWIGKEAVAKHHLDVPFHLLKDIPSFACGDPGTGNIILQADNLVGLKAILPYYAGQVKCITIDPPYNTGNEGWAYNDNVNSPAIKRWLGQVVGKEGETLDRHDRWLCMMYPRLVLLKQFLAEDGLIFVFLDDNEVGNGRVLADDVFHPGNFIATLAWQRRISPDARLGMSPAHDHILIYAKRKGCARFNKIPPSVQQSASFKNPDGDPRGPWVSTDFSAQGWRPNQMYAITTPCGKTYTPPPNRCWSNIESEYQRALAAGRMWFGKNGNARPRVKTYLSESEGISGWSWWPHSEVGHNQEAKKEINSILGVDDSPFDTPKPVRVIERIIQIATNPGDLVLDSFGGSGTTAHAVLKNNAANPDKAPRRFIMIEMEEKIAREVTAERVRRVAEGYKNAKGEQIPGLGGGFRFCELGEELFDGRGQIRESVKFADLARHVYFVETGEPLPRSRVPNIPLLGVHNGRAVCLLYNGVLKDKSPQGGNALTHETLAHIKEACGECSRIVVFGTSQRIAAARLKREGVTFKQIPYTLK
jgi:adenine-specific DNA-methyltransferase